MKTIKLAVYPKTLKTKDGKKFTILNTDVSMKIKNEDGTLSEPTTKRIELKFTKEVTNARNIGRGILEVKENLIDKPDVYAIKEDENGKKKYPCVWIKGNIENFTEIKKTPKQEDFPLSKMIPEDEEEFEEEFEEEE